MRKTELSGDREDRIEQLFHAALDRTVEERADFLAAECGDDAELLAEVEELIASLAVAPECLEHPAWGVGERAQRSVEKPLERRIGPYVLRELLGEGGMGSVYLADQIEPLRRQVALKLIKLGMDTKEVLRRFESERQTLAGLNHPNIAGMHEAGATPRGRPYFAMEYVDGERITDYCDRRRLGVRQRLTIFLSVCDAVQHAHQKGIIHRDLKPSNILVKEEDGRPVAKIIDFGVAKATGGRGTEQTLYTRRGQLIGTPGYISPEQAAAGVADVDTRTDVYSLGVLLYELLTGVLPFDAKVLRKATDEEIRRLLWRSEPPLASSRFEQGGARERRLALHRRGDPRLLARQLRGDLDWIARRALATDRAQRYATASELAGDIVASMNHEPVSAGPPSALYRIRKLARKHRISVASTAGAFFLTLSAALVFAFWTAGENRRLSAVSEEQQASLDSAMESASQVARENEELREEIRRAAPESSIRTTRVVNAGRRALDVGDVVEVVGSTRRGDARLLEVAPAQAGSSRTLLGAIVGRLDDVDGAPSEASVGPGACGLVAIDGVVDTVSVDTSRGPVRAHEHLGVGEEPGTAAAWTGAGASLGVALEDWSGPGAGRILIRLSPSAVTPTTRVETVARAEPHQAPTHVYGSAPEAHIPSWPWDGFAPASTRTSDGDPVTYFTGVAAGPFDGGSSTTIVVDGSSAPVPIPVPVPFSVEELTETGDVDHESFNDGGDADDNKASVLDADNHKDGSAGNQGVAPELAPPGGATPPPGPGGDLGGGDLTGGGGDHVDYSGGNGGGKQAGSQDAALSENGDWADMDDDGLVDVLLSTDAGGVRLMRNLGGGLFEDVTPWSNLESSFGGVGTQWLDVDGDRNLDLVSIGPDGSVRLHRGSGQGAFADTTESAGLARVPPVARLSSVDSNSDGRADLVITTREGELLLLINDGAGHFQSALVRERAPEVVEAVEAVEAATTAAEPRHAASDLRSQR